MLLLLRHFIFSNLEIPLLNLVGQYQEVNIISKTFRRFFYFLRMKLLMRLHIVCLRILFGSFGSTSINFVVSKSENLTATSSCVSEDTVTSFEPDSTKYVLSKSENHNTTSSSESESTASLFGSTTNFVLSESENPNATSNSESENTVSIFGSGFKNVNFNQIPSSAFQSSITASHLPPPMRPGPIFGKPDNQLSCEGSDNLASSVLNFTDSAPTTFEFGTTSSKNVSL